jgi:hypothetical protein
MPNLRVIHQNLADTASITADSTAGTYVASNLQTELKSQFHRSVGTTVVYTLTWTTPQTVSAVVLPCTNLTATATIAVKLQSSSDNNTFTDIVGATQTATLAASSTRISEFAAPTGNLFAYGAVTKTAHWFTQAYNNVKRVIITLVDTAQANAGMPGFIDCSRVICGNYWSPTYNASREGLVLTVSDTSTTSRNDAGDLISEQGFVHDQLQLNLGVLLDTDRDTLLGITRRRGVSQNILVSVFPENRTANELAYLVYGKRSNSSINYTIPGLSSTSLEITGW